MIKDLQQKGQNDIILSPGTLKDQLSAFTEEQLQQIVQQANQWAAFVRQMQWMDSVSKELKVVPELPSEVVTPRDTNPLTRVEYPEEGGVLTYMENFDHPFRGYPHHEFVEKIDSIKKFSRQLMSGFYHQLKRSSKIKFVTLLPAVWIAKTGVRAYVYTLHRVIERFLIKPERHCQFVRELHRAFSIERHGESEDEREFRLRLRDATCMILEFDNAYRFRAQDLLEELNKNSLNKDTAGELIRLFELMSSREHAQEIRDTWRLFKIGIRAYFLFDRNLRKMIRHVLGQLDLERIKLSVEDKEFCVPRKDYTFGFKINPSPEDQLVIDKWGFRLKFHEERDKIWDESTKSHQILSEAQKKEMDDLVAKTPKISDKIRKEFEKQLEGMGKEYNEKLQRVIGTLQAAYKPRHDAIIEKMSHRKINDLYQKHLEERTALDKVYNDKLKDAEDAYKIAKEKIIKHS